MSKQEQEIKLDKIDRKILYELDVDSRQTNSQISKKVGTSKEVVNYRINKLEEKGVIIRYSTIIDLFKIGYKKYKIYIKLRGASKEKKEEIGKYFFENKNTEWVIIGSGRWEVIANYFSRNEQEFDDEVQEFMNKYHEYIQEKA
ncbi:MAG: Lrp/AsnC family transcriptional regulator, partial [Nanoarchaeota archaeon]|nr:Lrp/AsnC family transcriptional regulator [Nanoarchaeota archaeon]